jgi:hypothetical protein
MPQNTNQNQQGQGTGAEEETRRRARQGGQSDNPGQQSGMGTDGQ